MVRVKVCEEGIVKSNAVYVALALGAELRRVEGLAVSSPVALLKAIKRFSPRQSISRPPGLRGVSPWRPTASIGQHWRFVRLGDALRGGARDKVPRRNNPAPGEIVLPPATFDPSAFIMQLHRQRPAASNMDTVSNVATALK
jgi:hypothetical protein